VETVSRISVCPRYLVRQILSRMEYYYKIRCNLFFRSIFVFSFIVIIIVDLLLYWKKDFPSYITVWNPEFLVLCQMATLCYPIFITDIVQNKTVLKFVFFRFFVIQEDTRFPNPLLLL